MESDFPDHQTQPRPAFGRTIPGKSRINMNDILLVPQAEIISAPVKMTVCNQVNRRHTSMATSATRIEAVLDPGMQLYSPWRSARSSAQLAPESAFHSRLRWKRQKSECVNATFIRFDSNHGLVDLPRFDD
jgi:hypothetical protein